MPRSSRRAFLRHAGIVAAATPLLPSWLASAANRISPIAGRRKLVILQLSGGNDGLNLIAPIDDPYYRELRPQLALDKLAAPRIAPGLAWHPAAAPLAQLLDAGHLHVVQGVGYPNPHRSHFRSLNVWESASLELAGQSSGWLGRYLDNECAGAAPYKALTLNLEVPLALRSEQSSAYAYGKLARTAQYLEPLDSAAAQAVALPPDDYISKVLTDTRASTAYLLQQHHKSKTSVSFPQSGLGNQLKNIAGLMLAGTQTDIYYASMGGFDTHAGQLGRHANLIEEYSQGISAFVRQLQEAKLFDDTLILTFSEFGRRIEENKSGGTDHGKANLAWLIGGKVQPATVASLRPNIAADNDGDLDMTIDFRSIYATILRRWLDTDPQPLVGAFPLLEFI